ncbi:hypothetical protein ID866_7124 [Astraeus odoratus]|nr:hypothetical protein ID866_7124 [Astraeus odoratus]
MYSSTLAIPLRPISCFSPGETFRHSSTDCFPVTQHSPLGADSLFSFLDFSEPPRSLVRTYSGYFKLMGEDTDGRRKRLLSKPKLPKLPADPDAFRPPPFPLNGATVPESPQRRKGMGSIRFGRKRRTSVEPVNSRGDLCNETPLPPCEEMGSHTEEPKAQCLSPGTEFEAQDRFAHRRGMVYHPYSRQEAPYMQAYDRTLLDNDRFSDILLRRLNPNASPSFLTFEQGAPNSVLDLGCGAGRWAMEAATAWPSALVIGFDLMHPSRLNGDTPTPMNLQWRQGNFVKYKLPFPKETFDLVRMANLSLCVPRDRWEHVFEEIRRVLVPGGQVEVIDDHLYFPYSKQTPQQSTGPQIIPRPSRSSFFDDTDDTLTQDAHALELLEDESDEDFQSTKSRFSTLTELDPVPPDIPYDPVEDWSRKVNDAKYLEGIFESMLVNKFGIDPRPREKIQDTIQAVFGRYNLQKENEFWLFLAPLSDRDSDKASVGSTESGSASSSGAAGVKKAGKDFVQWVTTVDRDKKDKKDKDRKKGDRSSGESLASFTQVPEMISAKAAGRLGITASPPRQPICGQSPGLIVNLQTFIPLSPFELEMHACKHMHTLLGCKAAIHDYIQEISTSMKQTVPESVVDDLLWDYECFRRKRFNWPAEVPEYQLDMSTVESPKSASQRHSSDNPWRQRASSTAPFPVKTGTYKSGDLDLVRSILVFSARKVDDEFYPLV